MSIVRLGPGVSIIRLLTINLHVFTLYNKKQLCAQLFYCLYCYCFVFIPCSLSSPTFLYRKYHGAEKAECLFKLSKNSLEVVVTTFETFRENLVSLFINPSLNKYICTITPFACMVFHWENCFSLFLITQLDFKMQCNTLLVG